jgi:hypothetical protein
MISFREIFKIFFYPKKSFTQRKDILNENRNFGFASPKAASI